jgi:D-alanine-D-alanine ligase
VKRILLLHDAVGEHAPPDEQDTLVQVEQIKHSLATAGYRIQRAAFSGDLIALEDLLHTQRFDAVFNLVETFHGSRLLHAIPLLCEETGIAFTGGNSTSLFLTGDKLLAKRLMRLANIPTPPWIDHDDPESLEACIGQTLICKPRDQEASVGIDDDSVFTCTAEAELRERIAYAAAHQMILERYIEGDECNISVVSEGGRPTIFPIAQMRFVDYPEGKPRIVGYEAKWDEHSFAYHHTVRSFSFEQEQPRLAARLRSIVEEAWTLFSCTGYGRVDVRIDAQGNPFVLELNMNPCIAQDSGYVAACAQAGLSYDEAIAQILKEALRE